MGKGERDVCVRAFRAVCGCSSFVLLQSFLSSLAFVWCDRLKKRATVRVAWCVGEHVVFRTLLKLKEGVGNAKEQVFIC